MITTRSLLCEAMTARWISFQRQRRNRLVLIVSSLPACIALSERWSVGPASSPCVRAWAIEAYSRGGESGWQTTWVAPGRLLTSEEDSDRTVGTSPPVRGLIEQSGAGSGQYAGRSTCASAVAGASAASAHMATNVLTPRTDNPPMARENERGSLCGDPPPEPQFGDRLVRARPQEAAHHLAHLVQALGAVEHRLVGSDVVVGGAHLHEVERPVLHVAELLDLAVGREDARAVRAQLAVLDDDAELDREPEHLAEEA